MIHTKNFENFGIEFYDKTLGTPSAQTIFRILVAWDSLSSKEIIEKSGLSESQVHNTLKDLIKLHLIEKKSRGIYALTQTQFASHLKIAYEDIIEEYIGSKLYQLSKEIDKMPIKKIEKVWMNLIDQWKPIIEKKFKHKAASLTNNIIDRLSKTE